MKYINLLLFLVLYQFTSGQTAVDTLKLSNVNQYVKIDSIRISGNDITEKLIILREMTFTEGDEVNSKIIDYNRERIYSLGLFNYVNLYLLKKQQDTVLLIDVYEKWYIYLFPFMSFNGGDFKNLTYGIKFRLENFRGLNETINANFAFGYDPMISLSYNNPTLFFDEDIGFGFEISYKDFANKSKNAEALIGKEFEYTFYTAAVSFSKRINNFNLLTLEPRYTYVESGVPVVSEQITASSTQIDRALILRMNYVYDSRDLKQFPKSGLYSSVDFTHKGFGINDISYNIFKVDLRQYNLLNDALTFRWRVNYRSTFGKNVPYYDYSFFGYEDYVRGHSSDEIEGTQYLLNSIELSYAIIDEWDFSLTLPLIPKNLTSLRIGLNFNIFADAGTTFDDFEELRFNNFLSGYGVGLNILFLPFNSLRLEYAFDEYMNGEALIGLGFSF